MKGEGLKMGQGTLVLKTRNYRGGSAPAYRSQKHDLGSKRGGGFGFGTVKSTKKKSIGAKTRGVQYFGLISGRSKKAQNKESFFLVSEKRGR